VRKMGLLLAVLIALVAVGSAQAHIGNGWGTTAVKAKKGILAHYNVSAALCWKLENDDLDRYHAHSKVTAGGYRIWDHFYCGLKSNVTNRICFVVYHATGQYTDSFQLGTYSYKGCTPDDLERID
jgi:hypothetical protein